jgi:hypothetical protein
MNHCDAVDIETGKPAGAREATEGAIPFCAVCLTESSYSGGDESR